MQHVLAHQIASQIQIKEFRKAYSGNVLAGDSAELIYSFGEAGYFAVFEYGAIAFSELDEVEQSKILKFTEPFMVDPLPERITEILNFEITPGATQVAHNFISLAEVSSESMRILLTYIAQSVALDFFAHQAQVLLDNTKIYSHQLEKKGHIGLSGDQLARYIAKSINLKHTIVASLYILDSPDETWENEDLDKLDRALKRTFDVQTRYRSIAEDIQMAQENLDLLRELSQARKSTFLEWIIILLILIEVLNMIVEKIWHLFA
jgi:uncharacterized Rmd1/YagE family protein